MYVCVYVGFFVFSWEEIITAKDSMSKTRRPTSPTAGPRTKFMKPGSKAQAKPGFKTPKVGIKFKESLEP